MIEVLEVKDAKENDKELMAEQDRPEWKERLLQVFLSNHRGGASL